eukprot:10287491-Ditylum_brightwellii.AAC.1
MAKVWNKIGHAGKKYESGSILSLQIPVTWSSSDCDENQISALDNPKRHSIEEQSRPHVRLPSISNCVTGTYSNSELNFLEDKLLDHCKKERDVGIIGEEISVEEWKEKIRAWRE